MKIAIVIIGLLIVLFIKQESFAVASGLNTDMREYIFESGHPGKCIGIIAGVHGNEPAGAIELQYMIDSGYFTNVKSGSVRIIPSANPLGLKLNTRLNMLTDMNRIFTSDKLSPVAQKIVDFFKPCDIVIDFHEGWGFHLKNSQSLGSTLCGNTPFAQTLATKIVNNLNHTELLGTLVKTGDYKKFTVLDRSRVCDIQNTLACYKLNQNEHHILVETSGQNDVQPIWIRRAEVRIILDSLIKLLSVPESR